MSSRRFYISSPPAGDQACVEGAEAHHLIHVLRAKAGQSIELLDGSGKVWRGQVATVTADKVEVQQLLLLTPEPAAAAHLILIQALAKADKLEWILQKSTELGIDEIFLLETERSVIKIVRERLKSKMERWQKIILAAAKQSRRNILPILHPPLDCPALPQLVKAGLRLFLSEHEKTQGLKPMLRGHQPQSVAYAVGPEGGWTTQEEQLFIANGYLPVTLGDNILRSETAAIAGLAILKYELDTLR
jgi:16S rRNA (uracil1498-N3)-methyltransferase